MTRTQLTRPLLFAAALFTLGNGYVHLDQWLNGYRNIPSAVPGSWVVRIGFPVAAISALALAGVLIAAATKLPKLLIPALLSTLGFQIGSLGVLIATRVGSVFGWSEPSWTPGANQARAVEIGGIVMIVLTGLLFAMVRGAATARTPRIVALPAIEPAEALAA